MQVDQGRSAVSPKVSGDEVESDPEGVAMQRNQAQLAEGALSRWAHVVGEDVLFRSTDWLIEGEGVGATDL